MREAPKRIFIPWLEGVCIIIIFVPLVLLFLPSTAPAFQIDIGEWGFFSNLQLQFNLLFAGFLLLFFIYLISTLSTVMAFKRAAEEILQTPVDFRKTLTGEFTDVKVSGILLDRKFLLYATLTKLFFMLIPFCALAAFYVNQSLVSAINRLTIILIGLMLFFVFSVFFFMRQMLSLKKMHQK